MFSTCIGWIFRRAPSPSRPQILVTSSPGRRTATSSSVPPPRSMGKPAEQPQCDVAFADVGRLGMDPSVISNPITDAPQAVEFNYEAPHWFFVDPKLKADFAEISHQVPGFVDLVSRDNADRIWIVAIRRSDAPDSYYAFDRKTKKLTKMFDSNPGILRFPRASKKPVVIKARDGLEMVSY